MGFRWCKGDNQGHGYFPLRADVASTILFASIFPGGRPWTSPAKPFSFVFSSALFVKMDPQMFMDVATTVTKLKMYPYFDVAHYLLMCLSVREDQPQQHSQQQGSGEGQK